MLIDFLLFLLILGLALLIILSIVGICYSIYCFILWKITQSKLKKELKFYQKDDLIEFDYFSNFNVYFNVEYTLSYFTDKYFYSFQKIGTNIFIKSNEQKFYWNRVIKFKNLSYLEKISNKDYDSDLIEAENYMKTLNN